MKLLSHFFEWRESEEDEQAVVRFLTAFVVFLLLEQHGERFLVGAQIRADCVVALDDFIDELSAVTAVAVDLPLETTVLFCAALSFSCFF